MTDLTEIFLVISIKILKKINIKRTQSDNQHSTEDTEAAPELNILESNFWADPNKEDSTL